VLVLSALFVDPATPSLSSLSLHDALPILVWSVDMAQLLFIWLCMLGACRAMREKSHLGMEVLAKFLPHMARLWLELASSAITLRSEEHTSELQSRENLVCRLLLEKKKQKI